MANRISVFETDPKELREQLYTAEDLDADEVASGLIALCRIVATLEARVEQLEKDLAKAKAAADRALVRAKNANDRATNVASMLANGIQPD